MADDPVVYWLRSIDATLKELLALSKSKRAAGASQPVRAENEPAVAGSMGIGTDADLDSQHGDPIVKFLPRDWTGDEFRHQPFSACTPEFLDELAKAFDYFARKKQEASDPKAKYEVWNAARARGWAARLRAGWKPKTVEIVRDDKPWLTEDLPKW